MTRRVRLFLQATAIAMAGAAVYSLSLRGDWVWDDAPEITGNPMLRDAHGLWRIWFAPASPDYFPLKSTVQWMEWHLWGPSPAGYHLVSLGLHVIAALLVWRLLARLKAGFAWWGGILFAVHPLAVESVAWTAEMKNPLSLVFLLLSLRAWLDGEDATGSDGRPRPRTGLSVACFLAAMLCKTTVVMLPVVLLLFTWWRRRRLVMRDLVRVSPFLAVSLALGSVTLWFQQQRAIGGMDLLQGGPATRFAAAGRAAAFYLGKCALPFNLAPIYPRWDLSSPTWSDFLPWVGFAAAGAWFWIRRDSWGRHALLGFGWFFLNLVPVMGFAPMAYVRISWVADHLAYLPLVGLVGLAAAGLGELRGRMRLQAGALAVLAVAGLGWESARYALIFRNEESLWTYTLARNPESWTAQNDLGRVLLLQSRVSEARSHFERALEINPDDAEAHLNLGLAFERLDQRPRAIGEYRLSLKLKPSIPEAHYCLGNALIAEGRLPEAIGELGRALQLRPDYGAAKENLASARNNYGVGLAGAGRWEEAAVQYGEALRLKPVNPEAQFNLGNSLAQAGRVGEAIGHFEESLRIRPDSLETRMNLASALAQAGRAAEAVDQYERILRAAPQTPEAHNNLGILFAESGRLAEARAHFAEAVRLKPGYEEARKNLARAAALEDNRK